MVLWCVCWNVSNMTGQGRLVNSCLVEPSSCMYDRTDGPNFGLASTPRYLIFVTCWLSVNVVCFANMMGGYSRSSTESIAVLEWIFKSGFYSDNTRETSIIKLITVGCMFFNCVRIFLNVQKKKKWNLLRNLPMLMSTYIECWVSEPQEKQIILYPRLIFKPLTSCKAFLFVFAISNIPLNIMK